MDVEVKVHERVARGIHDVFTAIVDPAKMSKYFISGASAALDAAKTIEWEFADVGVTVPIEVITVERDRTIVFEGGPPGAKTRTTITLAEEDGATVVTIHEAKFAMDEAGVKRALGQAAGWTYFLACLKAYLQFGVDLRAGLKKRLTDV